MRPLVEQTAGEAEKYINSLTTAGLIVSKALKVIIAPRSDL